MLPWPSPSLQGWLGTLFLGVVASALAFVVYSRALRELDASLVGAYLNLDPIVGVLTAVLFLGETLGAWQILGGVIALAGMWLASSREGPDGEEFSNARTWWVKPPMGSFGHFTLSESERNVHQCGGLNHQKVRSFKSAKGADQAPC